MVGAVVGARHGGKLEAGLYALDMPLSKTGAVDCDDFEMDRITFTKGNVRLWENLARWALTIAAERGANFDEDRFHWEPKGVAMINGELTANNDKLFDLLSAITCAMQPMRGSKLVYSSQIPFELDLHSFTRRTAHDLMEAEANLREKLILLGLNRDEVDKLIAAV